MNDPKKVIDTLEHLLRTAERSRKAGAPVSEAAAFYGAARPLLDDLDALLEERGLEGRGGEGVQRLRESFGGYLGIEPLPADSHMTYGAMGIHALRNLLPELTD